VTVVEIHVIVGRKKEPFVGKCASPGVVGHVLYRETLPSRVRVDMRLTRGSVLTERVNTYDSPPSILFRATDAAVPGVKAIL